MYRTKLGKNNTLGDLRPGESATITQLHVSGALQKRLAEMGLLPGARISVRRLAPLGDPMQLRVRGYDLAIRRADAKKITVERNKGWRQCV